MKMTFLYLEALPLKTTIKLNNNKTKPILLSKIKEPIAIFLLLLLLLLLLLFYYYYHYYYYFVTTIKRT